MKKQTLMAVVILSGILLDCRPGFAEWNIDLSRRQKSVQAQDTKDMQKSGQGQERSVSDLIFQSGAPVQEMVILNTEKGFVPSTVHVRQGLKYKIHVVNVNEKEKNVSFVLDSFGEHHATYYGKVKSFMLEPKKEGIYSFQCPETSNEGRMIVYAAPTNNNNSTTIRVPASEESSEK